MKKILILIICMVFLGITLVSASYNSINFTLEGGYVAPSYYSVNLTLGAEVDTEIPSITLNSPIDGYNSSSSNITFNGSVVASIGIVNVSLYGNLTGGSWHLNETNSSGLNDTIYLFNKNISDGTYIWNYFACSSVNCSWASSNFTFTIDTINPNINLTYPMNTSYTSLQTKFNYTYSDIHTESCWWTNDSGVTNNTVTCGEEVNGMNSSQGSNTWEVFINDSVGNENSSSVTFFIDSIYPTLSITYPENIFYNTEITSLNYTLTELNSDSCWLTKDGGENNYTLINCENFTGGENVLDFDSLDYFTSPRSLSTDRIQGEYSLNASTGRNQYNQLFTWNIRYPNNLGFDASKFVNSSDNTLGNSYLEMWVKIENCSRTTLPNGKCTLDKFEFGNTNSYNQTSWDVNSLYDYNLTDNTWEKITLNFNQSTYSNLATMNWSEVSYIEAYVANSSSEQTIVYFDDLRIYPEIISNEGSNTWIVYANDTLGNENSSSVTFFIDSIYPTINFTDPTETNNSYISNGDILVNVTVNDTNLKNITIYLFNSTGEVNNSNSTSSPLFVNFSGHPDGIYYFNATTFDLAENSNSTETKKVTIDTTNPDIDYGIGTESNNSFLSRTWIYVNITLNETNFANLTYRLYNTTGEVNTTTYNTQTLTINWTGLSEGNYTYNVTTFDNASRSNSTETRTIILDTTHPTISFVDPTENSSVYRSRDYIEINVTSNDTYLDSINITLYNSSNTLINSSTTTSSPNYINFSGLSNGIYYYNVTVNDSTNNLNTSTRNITLDTINPNINLTYPLNTTYIWSEPSRINYTYNDTNSFTCWYSEDGGITNTTVSCGTNVTGITPDEASSNTWTIYINDSAGNENSSSVTFYSQSPYFDINATVTSGTAFDFYPDNNTHLGVEPTNQTNTTGVITVHNDLGADVNVTIKLNETGDVILKIGNSSNYSLSKEINTNYSTLYSNLTNNSQVYLWAWADYNNTLQTWFPELSVKGIYLISLNLMELYPIGA